MTLIDMIQPLEDTRTLTEIARQSGVTVDQARAVCAALSNVPIRQAIRICTTAEADRIRRINRMTRKGAER